MPMYFKSGLQSKGVKRSLGSITHSAACDDVLESGYTEAAKAERQKLQSTAVKTKSSNRQYKKRPKEEIVQEVREVMDSIGTLFESIPIEQQGRCIAHLERVRTWVRTHSRLRKDELKAR